MATRKTKKKTADPRVFPAGRYYVGDPCYLFSNNSKKGKYLFSYGDWGELLKDTDHFERDEDGYYNEDGIFTWRGIRFFVSRTAHGDGTYEDYDGRQYSVDAGLIGCWPLPEGTSKAALKEIKDAGLGHICQMPRDFMCGVLDEDGTISIGPIDIETDWRDNYDDEDEDDY